MNASSAAIAHLSVAVIGSGQAGLSISWYLKRGGIDHVVFEKRRAGQRRLRDVMHPMRPARPGPRDAVHALGQ